MNSFKIRIWSYDVPSLEQITHSCLQELSQLKMGYSLVALPTKKELISLNTSPIRYNDSQEQFVRISHRRLITISPVTEQEIDRCIAKINKIKVPNIVRVSMVYGTRNEKIPN